MSDYREDDASGWLARSLKSARAEVAGWPEWKREAMRVLPDPRRRRGGMMADYRGDEEEARLIVGDSPGVCHCPRSGCRVPEVKAALARARAHERRRAAVICYRLAAGGQDEAAEGLLEAAAVITDEEVIGG